MHGSRWLHKRRPEGDPGRAVEGHQQQCPSHGQRIAGAGQPARRVSWRPAPKATARWGANPGISLALAASKSLFHPRQRNVATAPSPVPSRVMPTDHGAPETARTRLTRIKPSGQADGDASPPRPASPSLSGTGTGSMRNWNPTEQDDLYPARPRRPHRGAAN